jgi:hypothetical protein
LQIERAVALRCEPSVELREMLEMPLFLKTTTGTIAAGAALILLGTNSRSACADEWGCTVLLCLSNPAGPMAVPACVAPVQKLYAVLRSGGSPSCDTGAGSLNLRISRGSRSRDRWFEFTNSAGQTTRDSY